MDGWQDECIDEQMDRYMWVDEQKDGWMNEWVDGWMDGWVDGQIGGWMN